MVIRVIGGDPVRCGLTPATAPWASAGPGVGQGHTSVHAEHVSDMTMPGNTGGAKGPDFWCAFEAVEEEVIGDEPDNTR